MASTAVSGRPAGATGRAGAGAGAALVGGGMGLKLLVGEAVTLWDRCGWLGRLLLFVDGVMLAGGVVAVPVE